MSVQVLEDSEAIEEVIGRDVACVQPEKQREDGSMHGEDDSRLPYFIIQKKILRASGVRNVNIDAKCIYPAPPAGCLRGIAHPLLPLNMSLSSRVFQIAVLDDHRRQSNFTGSKGHLFSSISLCVLKAILQ